MKKLSIFFFLLLGRIAVLSCLFFYLQAISITAAATAGSTRNSQYKYLDIAQLGYEQYQDIFINGSVVQKATHNHVDDDTRYRIIDSVLSEYKRPFTMLDIGASQGYYSFRAASVYHDSVFVMIEGDNEHYPLVGQQLLDLCKANNSLNNIIFLNKALTIEDAKIVSECEHFDVVLALNIIHWFGQSWREIADAIVSMGSNIIIETPPQEAGVSSENNRIRREIEEYLASKDAHILARVPRHTSTTMATMYLITSPKNFLQRKTWLWPLLKEKKYLLDVDFNQKKLTKKIDCPEDMYQTSEWIPGINLITFKMYHGAFPTSEIVKALLSTVREELHNDWMINNMIIQGNALQLIDFNDPAHGGFGGNKAASQYLFENHCVLMDVHDPMQVKNFFWHDIHCERKRGKYGKKIPRKKVE